MIKITKKSHFTSVKLIKILASKFFNPFILLIEMTNILSFDSNRKFYADDHFPYGISRSGEFTREYASLLTEHGWAYQTLAEGSRVPATPEEKAFVAVCRGKKAAETSHEKAWMLFCSKISAPKAMISSPLIGSKSESTFNDDFESLAF